jgi:hypothetical protein
MNKRRIPPRVVSIGGECEGKEFPETRQMRKRSRGSSSAQMGRIKLSVMVLVAMPRIAVSLFCQAQSEQGGKKQNRNSKLTQWTRSMQVVELSICP